ncbi:NAD(P)-dependent oxidoreductase [Gynuella sunshinyii]|uniref:S-adenosylhomocysteine hydrolase n=1 Tax=Gynuella sunshinyii YC6258 TaxID=1445510 RepID=A0A0C5VDC3_9GAMM|nr:NAD(P)-dependent oxidoreductase [Gynuella sunshinyii]AJQ92542.1 S-adenosylhomocysteine hydrolase [Gynuella sunshinyii YC6258]
MNFTKDLDWIRRHMPRTARMVSKLGDCHGKKVAICTHLDIKMVPLYEGFLKQGGELFVTTCNPTTVRDEVVSYLSSLGARTHAWLNMSQGDWEQSLQQALDWQPDYVCEFGAEIMSRLQQRPGQTMKAGLEGTGSGVSRLKRADMTFPVFNWDDLDAKEGLHNRHMVGLTAWQAFFERTRMTLHEKTVVVIGYGLVGQGVAFSARAYGGAVTVAERDPARRLMAQYDGWHVSELDDAIAQADVVVTATGACNVITARHLRQLKNGAFVMNVGHVSDEIDTSELDLSQGEEVLPHVYEYQQGNKHFFLLANGAMFNLTASFGDSLNAFDVTLAIMASGLVHILGDGAKADPGFYLLPDAVWKPAVSAITPDTPASQ